MSRARCKSSNYVILARWYKNSIEPSSQNLAYFYCFCILTGTLIRADLGNQFRKFNFDSEVLQAQRYKTCHYTAFDEGACFEISTHAFEHL
jgi:hypothetical protein